METGGTLYRHAGAGIDVHLLCVTRGGEGWQGKPPGATKEDLPRDTRSGRPQFFIPRTGGELS